MIIKLKNAIIALVMIFLPLLVINYITNTQFYVEVVCMDSVCNHEVCSDRQFGDSFSVNGVIYHESTTDQLIDVFIFLVEVIYIFCIVMMFIKSNFPKTYKEITDLSINF